jgi:hypothetical protein
MKNYLIGGVVGLLFLAGGFYVGLRFAPRPVPKKALVTTAAKVAAPAPEAISLDILRKTTERMMEVNQALQARAHDVAAREQRVHEEEEELAAERAALDRSHDKFKELYGQFQQRLELVDSTEQDQLQRQVVMYNSMDPAQSIDLIRGLDDSTVTRLFSIMETKPLAKLVSAWKTKYAADAPRLLSILDGMGRVVPKDKMTMPENTGTAEASSAPAASSDSAATPVADAAAPAATPNTPASAPAPDPAADTSAKPDPLAPPVDSTPPAAPQDAPAPAATDSSAPADTHADAATTPTAADSPDGVATAKNN